jgi:tetratricopeptide (TPR) repeat protein
MNSFTVLKLAHLFSNRNYWFLNFVKEGRFQIVLLLLIVFCIDAVSQFRKPKSYALVVGISAYQDESISSLNFAHLDAEVFANFCMSPVGLNIPAAQVKVYTNDKASHWNIMNGLNWLKSEAKKDDIVYIYFAGHGSIESTKLRDVFLLPHDTKPSHLIIYAIPLIVLNQLVETLSVDKEAKVFVITDACHSGQLSDSLFNVNNHITSELSRLRTKNEVRITSCKENELSYEDTAWGNGRGAFSYYLAQGMSGAADGAALEKKDGNITVSEIKSYLSENVPDQVAKVKSARQNPMVLGKDNIVFNSIKFKPTNQGQLSLTNTLPTTSFSSSTANLTFDGKNENLENDIRAAIDKKSFSFSILSSEPPKNVIAELLSTLYEENKYAPKVLKSMETDQLVAKVLYEKVKHIIDLYLKGDLAELEKRRYYSEIEKPYEEYPYMLQLAINLLPSDHYLVPYLKLQKEYLSGLNSRLKTPFVKDINPLLEAAFNHQQKALAIDSNAAHVHNELGILYSYKKENYNAHYHFDKALSISPLWSLPYANLADLYFTEKDFLKSRYYLNLAKEKQNTLTSISIIEGNLYKQEDNLLFAEEHFHKAVGLNERDFLPFENLGKIYLDLQNFEKAEEYFFNAEQRKMNLVNEDLPRLHNTKSCGPNFMSDIYMEGNDTFFIKMPLIDSLYYDGIDFFTKNDYQAAKENFENVLHLDVNYKGVYHYLGHIYYYFKSYDLAEYYFKSALDFNTTDTLIANRYPTSIFNTYYLNLYIGKTYQKLGNFKAAIDFYNKSIDLSPEEEVAYAMLLDLYKSRGELIEAENTIRRLAAIHPQYLDNSLAQFYQWVLDTYVSDLQKTEHYSYKFASLLYPHALNAPYKSSTEYYAGYAEISNDGRLLDEVNWVEPGTIKNITSTCFQMLEKVASISRDTTLLADVYSKMGNLNLNQGRVKEAIENYEKMLLLKEDDSGIRTKLLYLLNERNQFSKSLENLQFMENSNVLTLENLKLLANYYMRFGNKEKAQALLSKYANAHPSLKSASAIDFIVLSMRFHDDATAVDLLQQHISKVGPSSNLEYMLARSYAKLNKGQEALLHLQNALNLGFDYGFVYKHDLAFASFRNADDQWLAINSKMVGYIFEKKARVK